MTNTLLSGCGHDMVRMRDDEWRAALAAIDDRMKPRLAFMSPEHHAVRYSVVRELPRAGRPLSVDDIARFTHLPAPRVDDILTELHRNLFFLVRNANGDVAWAFPVTVDHTQHAITFNSGERFWGA